jgi:hypothetical protein
MTDAEKRQWLAKLRKLEGFGELAAQLELEWFPKRRGRRSKSEWSKDEIAWKDLDDGVLWVSVLAEKRRLADAGHSPRSLVQAAQLAVARRHDISVLTLQKKLQAFHRRMRDKLVWGRFGDHFIMSK